MVSRLNRLGLHRHKLSREDTKLPSKKNWNVMSLPSLLTHDLTQPRSMNSKYSDTSPSFKIHDFLGYSFFFAHSFIVFQMSSISLIWRILSIVKYDDIRGAEG